MPDAFGWIRFFLWGWGITFTAYLGLQSLALLTLKRNWFVAALVPIPFMIWLFVASLQAASAQQDQWPVLTILASPLALIYVAAMVIGGTHVQLHQRRRGLSLATVVLITLPVLCYVSMFSAGA